MERRTLALMSDPTKIWVDGCFDFFHHGHAGALRQARKLGSQLYVGVHSDEAILKNKGPVVMHLDERVYAVDTCRWTTQVVPNAPYVTSVQVMDEYDCKYVAHGDDITTDADGNDCYAEVKQLHRFLEFKRTPNISTTDLIARMLSSSCAHHIPADSTWLHEPSVVDQFAAYATAANGTDPFAAVYNCTSQGIEVLVRGDHASNSAVLVSGAFDLFHCGDIEYLEKAKVSTPMGTKLVVGIYSDSDVQREKGKNYPIMNIYERALCVLQCKYVDAVILNCKPGFDLADIHFLPGQLNVDSIRLTTFKNLSSDVIIKRVLSNREQYEERQRRKNMKSINEEKIKAHN